jgi:hypothetical protein
MRVVGTAALFVLFVTAAPGYAQKGGHGGDKGQPQQKQQAADRKQGSSDKQRATPREQASSKGHATEVGRQAVPRGSETTRSQGQPASRGGDRAVARPQGTQAGVGASKRPTGGGVTGKAEPRSGGRYPTEVRNEKTVRDWQQQRGWQRQGAWGEHATWRDHRAIRWERDHKTWKQRGGYGGFFVPPGQFRKYFGPVHVFRIRTRPVIVMGYPRFRFGGYRFMIVDPWPEFWAEDWYAGDDVYIDYDDGYYLYNRRHPGVAIAISVVL